MNAKPLSDTVSPVTGAELQTWLNLPTLEPILAGLLVAATDVVITHLQRDLIQRDWLATVTTLSDFRGMCPSSVTFNGYPFLELPYSDLVEINSASIDDATLDSTEYETDLDALPGRIHFFALGWSFRIQVDYTAGMGATADDIPDTIKTAIKMIAAYLYEHRGSCDADDALKNSGATVLLKRYRVERL